MVLFCPHR
ncbi:hypothetical protein F383_22019 [Gossypium arboreum]|uniref:Uncharacterized protein n=1 Tax=Gossypium arboreum TaxID=29729 RepID=A0A0B0N5H8_GOSAR|nr:hypothetical protein F383_33846 [Gossypium arboreum]KHG18291.1 hypothetical protein F383_22019 [Gossypium arboreum]